MITQHDLIDRLNAEAEQLQDEQPELAHTKIEQALVLSRAQEPPYNRGVAKALLNRASLFERQGKLDQSINQLFTLLSLLEDSSESDLLAEAYYLIGWNYYFLGEYPTGLEYALKQLQIAEEMDSNLLRARAHNLMGALYGEIPDNDAHSIDHYKQSLALFRKINEPEDIAILLNNLCVAYESLDLHTAITYGKEALEIARSVEYHWGETLALGNLSVIYRKQNQLDEALKCLQQQFEQCIRFNFRGSEPHILLNMGRIYLATGKIDNAEQMLLQALTRAQDQQVKKWVYQAHQELTAVYEKQGLYEKALEHHKAYHQIFTIVLNEQTQIRIENLKLAHELVATRTELEQERIRNQVDRAHFEHLSQLQKQAMNTASHDLKSPLSSILLQIDLLERYTLYGSEQINTLLKRMRHSVDQMRHLITQLLDKAMLEENKPLRYEQVPLSAFLSEAVDNIEDAAREKTIDVQVNVPDASVFAVFDRERMRQVMNNLLTNAIKYTSVGGHIEIGGEVGPEGCGLWVRDDGIGIADEAIPHLFKPFYRADSEENQQIEGTGLGLSIVYTIVAQHGGKIMVNSTLGKGTTFTVSLPAKPSDAGSIHTQSQ